VPPTRPCSLTVRSAGRNVLRRSSVVARAGGRSGTTLVPVLDDSVLVRWCLRNGLQLNPDKSEVLAIGTSTQLQAATSAVSSVSVAGVDLTVSGGNEAPRRGVGPPPSFDSQVTDLARASNYHAQAVRHIRHPLTTELAVTLACSLILCRLDYCNAVCMEPQQAVFRSCNSYRTLKNTGPRIVLQAPRRTHVRPLFEHWLAVRQRIEYKLFVAVHKVRSTSKPTYLGRHVKPRETTRRPRSSSLQLLQKPTTRTHSQTAPSVALHLPSVTLMCRDG